VIGDQLAADHKLDSWLIADEGREFLQQSQMKLTKPNP
jgi:hypothetical protein